METSYWIDERDIIIRTSANWNDFARDNDGAGANAAHIIGRPLRNFIGDDNTRMWLDAMIQYVRVSGKSVIRPYRCDSPRERRFMEMEIRPEADGSLCLRHLVLRVEERAEPYDFSFGAKKFASSLSRCSVCNRVSADGTWLEVEDFIRLYNRGRMEVSHDVCPDCRNNLPAGRQIP
ncbi:MAG: hypothetical protein JXR89_00695 [Deltaproteobacteria bacterium]|nr:hypothetical protein [Deltaproteobacteria bacterium]